MGPTVSSLRPSLTPAKDVFLFLKGKELPTFKDMDFRNNMQKVYVTDEQKEKVMEKLNRDVEVGDSMRHFSVVAPLRHTEAPSARQGRTKAVMPF